ncbi:hypothetical protein ANN_16441 [Periplaneta americana]|uniref:Uncharacterized protein n=1 Tax=Periplaneta americana TaxID=6978 RepID=A0ABQ8SK84_PERAM|nr:hypothetical protein ANN_16441 [Periplaneta americana]
MKPGVYIRAGNAKIRTMYLRLTFYKYFCGNDDDDDDDDDDDGQENADENYCRYPRVGTLFYLEIGLHHYNRFPDSSLNHVSRSRYKSPELVSVKQTLAPVNCDEVFYQMCDLRRAWTIGLIMTFCNDEYFELQIRATGVETFIDASKYSLIMLGLIKQFVKAMNTSGRGFMYLSKTFLRFSAAKIKEGVFLRPLVRGVETLKIYSPKLVHAYCPVPAILDVSISFVNALE